MGWLKAESLVDGAVDLAYVALLNDAIKVKRDNDQLAESRRPKHT